MFSDQDFIDDYQELFDNYLLARHPREDKITRNWRLSQYKPFTRDPFLQITDVIKGAVFQDGQYTIQLPNKNDEQYIWSKSFEGFDLIGLFSNKILSLMLEDPNGYLVRMPSKPSYETVGPVEINLHYVCIKDVIRKPNTGDFIFYSRDRKLIYWINANVIIRFTKDEKTGKWKLENENGYYAHLLGRIPADILGGRYETDGYYSSFLNKAVPIADEYISNYSAKQMIDKEASHPYIQQMNIECHDCDGTGKIQVSCNVDEMHPHGFKLDNCPKCKGKKYISINPADRFEVPKDDMDKPAIRIINPDVTLNTYHKDNTDDLFQKILDALHLTMIREAQSGAAKAIDQEKLYQFISGISNHIFDNLIYNSIKDIIAYRNVRVSNGVTLPADYEFTFVKPQQFNIKTAMDLLNEINETQTANLPLFIRRKMIGEFVDKRFSSDDVMQKKSKFIQLNDPLFAFSTAELSQMKTVDFEQIQYSQLLPMILDEIEKDLGQTYILDSSFEDLKTKVDEIFSTKNVNNSIKKADETANQ
ncbi:zinc finger-like domain-containing protein [Chryseobacterium sp. G0240]|uniref:zinc finger-like domain-containing protein n=1 Tax=Chryseobacterium sp. G0240 TaxID=2487066 RepID=UPI0011CD49B5|nr:zinc finger-like domain-containing protein [Chryseobacterium sp. G0240]